MEKHVTIMPPDYKPAITYGRRIFDHGFVRTGYCEDMEGNIIDCQIHFGKPYWGYYKLTGKDVKDLTEYLNARFHSTTLEEGLRQFAEHALRYETKDEDRRSRAPSGLNDMFAIMDKLPDVLDELKIDYEVDMSFN